MMRKHFPGFADAGSFDMKVDEIIAGLGAQMGVALPEGDLIGDVLTGEIGLALGDLEAAVMGGDPTIIVGLATADAEAMVAAARRSGAFKPSGLAGHSERSQSWLQKSLRGSPDVGSRASSCFLLSSSRAENSMNRLEVDSRP